MACPLTINGQDISVHDLSPSHEEGKDSVRALDGTLRETIQWTKRGFVGKTTGLTRAQAQSFVSLVRNGELSIGGDAVGAGFTAVGSINQQEEIVKFGFGMRYRVPFSLREV